jgi:integrase
MARPQRKVPWFETRNGIGYAAWYDPQARRTKRVSLRTDTIEDGQKAFAAFLSTGSGYMAGMRLGDRMTVRQALMTYESEQGPNCVDRKTMRSRVKTLLAHFGDEPLADIDIPRCRVYGAVRAADGIAIITIRRELGILQAAANHAKRWKRIGTPESPGLPTIELPAALERAGEAPWITKAELATVLDMAEGRLHDFIVLAYYTASRRTAIERLQVDQVRLDLGRVHLAKDGERKTKKRRPIVPIFPEMREALEQRIAAAEDGWLFGRRWKAYEPFVNLLRRAGITNGRRHPHVLRHSRATHLLLDGASIYAVAKLLGDTVSTVERAYGHCSIEYLSQLGQAAA